MAAQEYFSNAPMPHSQPYSPYNQQPHQQGYHSPRPQYSQPAPPPYQEHKPGVHFAPEPVELPQRHSFSHQQRPSIPQPNLHVAYQQNPYASSNVNLQPPRYGSYSSQGTPQQKPQHLSPHMRPYANPNGSQYSLDQGGYSSDPEPRRRRHRNRKDSGESRDMRSSKSTSRSKNADAFVGAAGGGLIGDLIFPGLGTLGGAAIGWLGGKDYGNHRKQREEKRHKEQRKWEDKFEPGRHHRSRSRDRRSRANSTDIGEIDPRDDYRRKRSH